MVTNVTPIVDVEALVQGIPNNGTLPNARNVSLSRASRQINRNTHRKYIKRTGR